MVNPGSSVDPDVEAVPTTLEAALVELAEVRAALRALAAGEADPIAVVEPLERAPIADGPLFSAVVEALQEGVLVQDGEGRVLEANGAAARILGVRSDWLVTDPPSPLAWRARAPGGAPISSDQAGGRDLLAGEPVLGVMVQVDRDDRPLWLEVDWVPLHLPGDREVPLVVSSFRDVTARVEADEAIRFQRLLLDTVGQSIIAVDRDGIVLYWNSHAEQLYGWSAAEACGRSIADLILPEETVALGEQMVAEMLEGETWSGDHWVTRRDGTRFPVFATSTPIMDDAGQLTAMISVSTDITDRKQTEDRARRLSAIVESSSDAILGMTLDRTITSWNSGAVAMFGYSAAEIIGQGLGVLAASSRDYAELIRSGVAQGLYLSNVETLGVTKDGTIVQLSLSVSPILDERGQPVGLSCIARDITGRVELERLAVVRARELVVAQHAAELEAMERDEANRENRAKSEFLSRMSHELRTPLNAVLGFGQILSMDDLTSVQHENVGLIRSAGEHLLDLINDVLDISSIEAGALTLSLEPVDLNEVVDHALSLIRPQAAEQGIAVPVALGGSEFYVHADRQRLLQVLLNLLSNAVKYNRPGGAIELRCESSGGAVSLSVADTGFGLSESDLGKIFTPFERLGAASTATEGTGVGLTLSRSLSREMGGSLTAFSTVGTGSTFTLELPMGSASDIPPPAAAPAATNAGSEPLTVLAIEDNVINIRLLEQAMERCGNVTLLTALEGRLGLELAAQHQPDLVLLDLHLPDVHGGTVLERLRSDPATAAIPVVVCSGDSSPAQSRMCLEAGAAAYLSKPYALKELFGLVEGVRSAELVAPPRHR